MKNLTWQNPEQLFVAQELINKVKSKCCGIKVNKNMDYLFLRRHRRTATSNRQKSLLLKAAERQWELQFANKGTEGRKVDCALYKCILYNLEIKQVFLDSELSLKKFSVMIDTNQTYLSNVVNKYFNCNLKELLNTYRVEYAKEGST